MSLLNISKFLSYKTNISSVLSVGFNNNNNNNIKKTYYSNKNSDWIRAVNEAEKIVGYPTSFLNLRWLLSDEIANVALHLRKLIGTSHPLLKTAKGLFHNSGNNPQTWGLIVLLVSKAAGYSENVPDFEQDKAAGVMHNQRALAEVTEMIRTSHLVHKGMVNLQKPFNDITTNDMLFGNKIALLSGDYLLSKCCSELALLRNQEITELMSSAVRDLSEGEFIGPRDKQNNPLPSKPRDNSNNFKLLHKKKPEEFSNIEEALGDAKLEWTYRNMLNSGSLLGKSCQGTLKLAGHSTELQEIGYNFGKHLALAWQTCVDLEPFLLRNRSQFSLVSAPVLFHLQYDPYFYEEIEKGYNCVGDVDYETIRNVVLDGPGIEETKELRKEHSGSAVHFLDHFPSSDARSALRNIIEAMQI